MSTATAQPALDVQAPALARVRLGWVDVAKGVGILLVVFGHVLRGLIHAGICPRTPLWEGVDRFLYAFHMPLFFLLAGLFLPRALGRPWKQFGSDRARTLLYPYLLWGTLQTLFMILASGHTNRQASPSDLWRIVYTPPMQFWFLYVLMMLTAAMWVWRRLGGPLWLFLVAMAALRLSSYADATLGWPAWPVLNSLRDHAVYLALGAVLGERGFAQAWAQIPARALAAIPALGLGVAALAIALGWYESRLAPVAMTAAALAGVAGVLAAAVLLERSPLGATLEFWGRLSLEIYVAHTIASAGVRVLLKSGLHHSGLATHIALGVLAGMLVPIALHLLARRLGVRFLFTLPAAKAQGPTGAGAVDRAGVVKAGSAEGRQTAA